MKYNRKRFAMACLGLVLVAAVPVGGAAPADDRHRHLPYRISLCDTPKDPLVGMTRLNH